MLPYSENDICIMYRCAKDKKQQLQILAEMNVTDKRTIKAVLEKNGYKVDYTPLPKQKKCLSVEDIEKRLELCRRYSEQGFTIKQAAQALGMENHFYLRKWAARYGVTFAYESENVARKAQRAKIPNEDIFRKYKEAEQKNLTIAEAALFIGVSPNQVRKYAKKYGIEFIKSRRGPKKKANK